jgi:glycosyltransferase involved in cell wall biosynthesis
MSEAFAELGLEVSLYYVRSRDLMDDVRRYYGVAAPLHLRPLPRAVVPMRKSFRTRHVTAWGALAHAVVWSAFVARITSRQRADLYVVREPVVAWWLARRGVSVVLEIHDISCGPERVFVTLAGRHRSVLMLLAVTEGLRWRCVQSLRVPDDRISVLSSGVDLARMRCDFSRDEARARLGLPVTGPIVAYTGHLYPEKGVETLIQALPMLGSVHVVVAGGMPDDVARIRCMAQRFGARNVTLVGHVRPGAVPVFLRAADVAVLPYSARFQHSLRYTSPLKLFEYMAMGCSIVASDLPSIREVLRHQENALLVPPDDPGALAEGIQQLVVDRALGERLGARARRDVGARTWRARASRILEIAGQGAARE